MNILYYDIYCILIDPSISNEAKKKKKIRTVGNKQNERIFIIIIIVPMS